VGYLSSRDEITELWVKGDLPGEAGSDAPNIEDLINHAARAANGARAVLNEAVKKATLSRLGLSGGGDAPGTGQGDADAVMTT
jgi:exosome complex component MTR3